MGSLVEERGSRAAGVLSVMFWDQPCRVDCRIWSAFLDTEVPDELTPLASSHQYSEVLRAYFLIYFCMLCIPGNVRSSCGQLLHAIGSQTRFRVPLRGLKDGFRPRSDGGILERQIVGATPNSCSGRLLCPRRNHVGIILMTSKRTWTSHQTMSVCFH